MAGIPALGTSSTQGDGGVNDSFGHPRPPGDSSGGDSAAMTCVMARSTDKGEMERDKVKRRTDRVQTLRETRVRLCGYLPPEAPARPRTSFPSPSHPQVTCHWCGAWAEAGVLLPAGAARRCTGVSHALSAEDAVASEAAEPALEGAREPTLPADRRCHTDLSVGKSRSVLCYRKGVPCYSSCSYTRRQRQ